MATDLKELYDLYDCVLICEYDCVLICEYDCVLICEYDCVLICEYDCVLICEHKTNILLLLGKILIISILLLKFLGLFLSLKWLQIYFDCMNIN